MVMHPTLPFATQRIENRYFRVGLEGIRYEPGWSDEDVGALLAGSRPLIFAFGGSTTWAMALPAMRRGRICSTLSSAQTGVRRTPATGPVVINFGAQAYDQRTEIDKLIYLLRRGYRPSKVVMLDGWNDLFIARSNMRAVDRVAYHGFAQGRGEIAFTPGSIINRPSYLHLLLEYSPLQQLIRHWQGGRRRIETVKIDRDAFVDGFDFREADCAFRHWALFGEHHLREDTSARSSSTIATNLKLLKALADAYGFGLHAFYQPIGLLDDTNPFVSRASPRSPRLSLYLGVGCQRARGDR